VTGIPNLNVCQGPFLVKPIDTSPFCQVTLIFSTPKTGVAKAESVINVAETTSMDKIFFNTSASPFKLISVHETLKLENRNWKFGLHAFVL